MYNIKKGSYPVATHVYTAKGIGTIIIIRGIRRDFPGISEKPLDIFTPLIKAGSIANVYKYTQGLGIPHMFILYNAQ